MAASKALVRRPNEVLRLAAQLELQVGSQFARQLHDRYPADFTRRVGLELLLLEGGQEIMFERDGLTWRTDLGDEIGRQLFWTGRYEGAEIDAVLRWLSPRRPTGVVIDAGANIGTTSIPFAQAGYRVIAIEPVPDTFAMLRANVEVNGFGPVISCVQSAVGDQSGEIGIWTGVGSGQSELVVDGKEPAMTRWGPARRQVKVPVGRLDEIMAGAGVTAGDVALVWADVQGAETSVIRTGAGLWAAGVPLYLEVDPTSLDLHAGLGDFLDAARSSFGSFITRDELLADGTARPITELANWMSTIPADGYSDALLVPTAQ